MKKKDLTRRNMLGLMAAGGAGLGTLSFGRAPALAQAGSGLLARVQKEGVIKIGLTNGLPYSIMNPDGTLDGVAPTLVKAVMARLGVPKVEGVVATYGQLIPGLLANRWDMVGADMTITSERCAQVAYCDPFTVDYAAWVYLPGTYKDPPKTLKEIGARKTKLAMLAGSYNLKLIQSMYEKPDDYIQIYPDTPAIFEAITAKRVEIGCTGGRNVKMVVAQKPGSFEYLYPAPDDMTSAASAAFKVGDTDLRAAFRAEFQKMKASGEWRKIIESFGFEVFPGKENVTAEQACAGAVPVGH